MVTKEVIKKQLEYCLNETHLTGIGKRYSGKVRDTYSHEGKRVLVTTDRLSCFDKIVTLIPFKGQVLNQLALYWFDKTQSVIPNHVINSPHPNIIIAHECTVLPIEVVVRGYLTGSAWRDYEAGNAVSGIILPQGLKKSSRFESPLLTPSTKAPQGDHDMPISEDEIVSQGLVRSGLWSQVRTAALSLFELGQREAAKNGLILVDTKYEFGLLNDQLMLVDEIHTLDSSRYWVASEYEERFAMGSDQIMLDKEPTRQWLLSQGYKGEGPIPQFTDEHRVQISEHYISSYERITGEEFSAHVGSVEEAMKSALR